jgi:hypothetical protein
LKAGCALIVAAPPSWAALAGAQMNTDMAFEPSPSCFRSVFCCFWLRMLPAGSRGSKRQRKNFAHIAAAGLSRYHVTNGGIAIRPTILANGQLLARTACCVAPKDNPQIPTTVSTRCRLAAKDQPRAPGQCLRVLLRRISLLHGAQTRLVQNAAIIDDASRTLAAWARNAPRLVRRAAENHSRHPVSLQTCHAVQRRDQAAAAPASCCAPKEGLRDN